MLRKTAPLLNDACQLIREIVAIVRQLHLPECHDLLRERIQVEREHLRGFSLVIEREVYSRKRRSHRIDDAIRHKRQKLRFAQDRERSFLWLLIRRKHWPASR